jgi:hypothetical protein
MKHYLYGGVPESPTIGREVEERKLGLHVRRNLFTALRPSDAEQGKALLDIVNTCRADILWVG